MSEDQNIEYKESWRDEYLKWICGFANAQGGRIFIGIEDSGRITGINNTRKLMEEIPNKVRDTLGVMIDVNLHKNQNKEYLEIRIDPYPNPVNYKGQYHYRSGSTKQELKGVALDKFLLQKYGKYWDGVPMPRFKIDDLSERAFTLFRKLAARSKRVSNDVLEENNLNLLEKMKLIDGGYLKRAAILLFHPDPEELVTGAYVKIGFFNEDHELLYQDTIHGHLFEQVDKTMDLLLTKYQKALISYEGVSRIETYMFPEEALREALLNAIAHKDYASCIPIQISVYEDKIMLWNQGYLPATWTMEKLFEKHSSEPYNPDVASAFFRAGHIESWGQGILKIIKECKKENKPAPVFNYDAPGFTVTFETGVEKVSEETVVKVSGKTSGKTSGKIIILMSENINITIPELASLICVTERSIERSIQALQKSKKLERIGPAKGGYWKVL
jgi:ATP-dependent DNA helicase RecG